MFLVVPKKLRTFIQFPMSG